MILAGEERVICGKLSKFGISRNFTNLNSHISASTRSYQVLLWEDTPKPLRKQQLYYEANVFFLIRAVYDGSLPIAATTYV